MNKQKGSTMHFSRTTIGVFALVCGLFGAAVAAQAATIIVTSDSGGIGGPDCTLRDAITAANSDTATGGCPAGSGADIIELPVGVTITLTERDNSKSNNGLPSATSVVTINGNGTTVRRDTAAPAFHIIHVATDGNLGLNDLTVSNGVGGPLGFSGGGIRNTGTLSLTNCTVSGNDGSIYGAGGIGNSGTMTLTDSTVSGNTASYGAGILNHSGMMALIDSTVSGNTASVAGGGIRNKGTLTMTNSTVSGNTAEGYGGGIYNRAFGTATLINSTVSGNLASFDGFGGGIANFGTLTLTHSTVSGNIGSHVGGIYNDDTGTLSMIYSIVANHGSDCENDGGTLNDDGYNIIEDGTCITAETSMMGDPMLGPLQDNGGPTETHALLAGSPAIDEIPSEICEVDSDQRGVLRPQGDGCDIGSYELKSFCLADFDGDGTVDASDLAQLLGGWGPCADCEDCPSDFDGDCIVNAADLALLLGNWGACF